MKEIIDRIIDILRIVTDRLNTFESRVEDLEKQMK